MVCLGIRRLLDCSLILYLLSRIKGKHLCRSECARRRRAEGNLDWHVCIGPAPYVFRCAFSTHWYATCAWLVVVAAANPALLADSVFAPSKRGGSPCPGLAWIYGIHA